MTASQEASPLEHDLKVRRKTYEWSVRLFRLLQKVLKVNVKLHDAEGAIDNGDIFLFNHFARFETFIPQYLIYRETGALSRSIASSEFFSNDDSFSNYLLNAGAVPNNLPNLLPFLAAEVIRGRKVIVFPEGGMVKDRRVIDDKGQYAVYSRTSEERRKHHSGPAVLALALDLFKRAVMQAHQAGQTRRLGQWSESLELEGVDQLLAAARKPTVIVPANITFYPIRVSDNLLRKGAELLSRGLSRRMTEELLIEGNILLKHTDMDVRLGEAIEAESYWRWFDHRLLGRFLPRVEGLQSLFNLRPAKGQGLNARLLAMRTRRNVLRVRDEYMRRMYSDVTVNLSHVASSTVLRYLDEQRSDIDTTLLHKTIYLSVKKLQRSTRVHLHRSLRNPETYSSLLHPQPEALQQFLKTTSNTGLIAQSNDVYQFLPKLREEHGFDDIRLENLVEVYANEVAPIPAARLAIAEALEQVHTINNEQLSRLRLDDEIIEWEWDRVAYSKPRHADINALQSATADAKPFFLEPDSGRGVGVLLVHGFLASPAEMRGLGEHLREQGFTVFGVRLKGHGTSPWDLRDRRWEDWLISVRRGYELLSAFCSTVHMVGFSTGGGIALRLAAEKPDGLGAVVATCVPLKFQNKNMAFVPLMHGANRLVKWVSSAEGVMPFRPNDNTEHPDVNYRHMPIRGLYELRRLVDELKAHVKHIIAPVLIVQGTHDPVVVPSSGQGLFDLLKCEQKQLRMIESQRHGLIYDSIGPTHDIIAEFLTEQSCKHQEVLSVLSVE